MANIAYQNPDLFLKDVPLTGKFGVPLAKKRTVDARHPDLYPFLGQYKVIHDCLRGELYIKSLGAEYLPPPDAFKNEAGDSSRYADYKTRASFLGVTARTLRATVGKLFSKGPSLTLPALLDPMIENANGYKLSVFQLLEQSLASVFAYGRAGLYVDFLNTKDRPLSSADRREISPTLNLVQGYDIINWRIDRDLRKLVMLVIREDYEEYDAFWVTKRDQYRVFRLSNGLLMIDIWRKDQQSGQFYVYKTYFPKDYAGEPWTEIPFALMGAIDNDWTLDDPPLYSIASLDLQLLRNSADLEESAFIAGQPTFVLSGVDEKFMHDLLKTGLRVGGRNLIPVKQGGNASLLQAQANNLILELKREKMDILRAFGATLFVPNQLSADQTATGAVYEALSMHAPLISSSRNVVDAFLKGFRFASRFVGTEPAEDAIEITLNSDLLDSALGPMGLTQALQLWQASAITWDEMREQLKIHGLTKYDPEVALELIQEEGFRNEPPAIEESSTADQIYAGDEDSNSESDEPNPVA